MFNLKSLFTPNNNGKNPARASKDPVCGMTTEGGIALVHEGVPYSFCSDHCKQQFEKDPATYIIK